MSVFADLFAQADARAAERLHSVHDARRVARRRLPAVVFDYIDGAADDELTMRRNEAAFAGVTFRQKAAVGRIVPSLRTSVF